MRDTFEGSGMMVFLRVDFQQGQRRQTVVCLQMQVCSVCVFLRDFIDSLSQQV